MQQEGSKTLLDSASHNCKSYNRAGAETKITLDCAPTHIIWLLHFQAVQLKSTEIEFGIHKKRRDGKNAFDPIAKLMGAIRIIVTYYKSKKRSLRACTWDDQRSKRCVQMHSYWLPHRHRADIASSTPRNMHRRAYALSSSIDCGDVEKKIMRQG
jgi:hypothetical protein